MNAFWQGFLWGVGIIAALEVVAVFVFLRIMSQARITG